MHYYCTGYQSNKRNPEKAIDPVVISNYTFKKNPNIYKLNIGNIQKRDTIISELNSIGPSTYKGWSELGHRESTKPRKCTGNSCKDLRVLMDFPKNVLAQLRIHVVLTRMWLSSPFFKYFLYVHTQHTYHRVRLL